MSQSKESKQLSQKISQGTVLKNGYNKKLQDDSRGLWSDKDFYLDPKGSFFSESTDACMPG